MDRGRYVHKPYPGAFHGCNNTTPPGLELEFITNDQAQHYEKEVSTFSYVAVDAFANTLETASEWLQITWVCS